MWWMWIRLTKSNKICEMCAYFLGYDGYWAPTVGKITMKDVAKPNQYLDTTKHVIEQVQSVCWSWRHLPALSRPPTTTPGASRKDPTEVQHWLFYFNEIFGTQKYNFGRASLLFSFGTNTCRLKSIFTTKVSEIHTQKFPAVVITMSKTWLTKTQYRISKQKHKET